MSKAWNINTNAARLQHSTFQSLTFHIFKSCEPLSLVVFSKACSVGKQAWDVEKPAPKRGKTHWDVEIKR